MKKLKRIKCLRTLSAMGMLSAFLIVNIFQFGIGGELASDPTSADQHSISSDGSWISEFSPYPFSTLHILAKEEVEEKVDRLKCNKEQLSYFTLSSNDHRLLAANCKTHELEWHSLLHLPLFMVYEVFIL